MSEEMIVHLHAPWRTLCDMFIYRNTPTVSGMFPATIGGEKVTITSVNETRWRVPGRYSDLFVECEATNGKVYNLSLRAPRYYTGLAVSRN